MGSQPDRTTMSYSETCQFKRCSRPQYRNKTTAMYKPAEEESHPDDVQQRSICRWHWILDRGMTHGPPIVVQLICAAAVYLYWDAAFIAVLLVLSAGLAAVLEYRKAVR